MINLRSPFWHSVRKVLFIIGTLFLVTGVAMALPILTSLFYVGEGDFVPLCISSAISISLGVLMRWIFRSNIKLEIKDALFIATFGWVFVSAISALPFILHGSIPNFTIAFFSWYFFVVLQHDTYGIHTPRKRCLG